MSSVFQYFDEFVMNRIENTSPTKRMKEADGKVYAAYEQIKGILGDNQEAKALLFELESLVNMTQIVQAEDSYKQGYNDGVKIITKAMAS